MPTSNVGANHNRIILSMSYKRTNDIPPHLIEEIVSTSLAGKKSAEKFIRGPVPVWWLRKAWTECRPASLVFGLLLFLRQGMGVKPKPITKAEMELFGITRWSKREALEDLERAGLIRLRVERRRLVPEVILTG
jgi:hypothetical protein